LTGHDGGVITVNIAEADDATVAAQCHQLKESIIDDEEAGRKRGRAPVDGSPLRLHRLPLHKAVR
jgi:hypothetical protein